MMPTTTMIMMMVREQMKVRAVYSCMYVCTCVGMYVCAYVRVYVCMHVCVYVCTYICVYGSFYVFGSFIGSYRGL